MDATDTGRNPVEELAEEFIERRRRGETPSLEEYALRFPDLADQIRGLFPALVMMEDLGADTTGTEVFGEPAPDRPAGRSGSRLEQLGDYRILREVGRGGMGVVYEAEQESLGRRVALKVLSGNSFVDRGQVRRFEREARSAARLHHTNIVPVFGVGEQDGLHYYVMQFIQGQGLDEVLTELKRLRVAPSPRAATAATRAAGPVSTAGQSAAVAELLLTGEFRRSELRPGGRADDDRPVGEWNGLSRHSSPEDGLETPSTGNTSQSFERDHLGDSSVTLPGQSDLSTIVKSEIQFARSVARIGVQVAGALEYANTQGILHRDIKPSNLLLDLKGTVWVTDFGLAKATEGNDLTHTGDIVGTLRYMAPERFRGRCDARADVYSLGLTLYELLALRPAFDETDRQQLIQRVTQDQPARLKRLNAAVPRDLETIIQKSIAREPNDRYATAAALAEDLERFIDDKPIRVRHILPAERLLRWGRRNPMLAGLTAAVLLLLLTVAVGSSLATVWLGRALRDTQDAEAELTKALRETQVAQADATDKLWGSYVAQARAGRLTRRPGQRFASLRTIKEALKLSVPKDRSLNELRTEAIACLCLPDLELAKEWDGCPTGTTTVAIDNAFERYARGDKDGNVSVHRIADDDVLMRIPGEGIPLWGYDGVEFSHDGRFLHTVWSGPQGFRGRLWRIDQAQPLAVFNDDHIHLAFRPDSRQFAASYPDGSIRIFDTQTCREIRRLPDKLPQAVGILRWNPRLPQLAFRTGAICRVINVDNWEIESELSAPGGCDWIDWHPEGRVIAVSSFNRKIYLYEVDSRRLVVPPLEGHKSIGIIIRFNHAGDRLASNDWTGMLRLWDTRTGRQLLAQPSHGNCLAFSRDDGLIAADLSSSKVRLFHFHAGDAFRTEASRTADGYSGCAIWAHDSRLLALRAPDGVVLVDVERGEEVARLSLPDSFPFHFESSERALWTTGTHGILRWPFRTDPISGKLIVGPPQTMAATISVCNVGSSADGQQICIPSSNLGNLLWRRASQEMIPLGAQEDVRSAAVSPDGKWVATGSHTLKAGAGAKVWDGTTGQHVADLPVGGLCFVRFSPDQRWLVTTGGGPRIWSVGTWQEGPKLGGPDNTAGFCFSADSQLLALEGSQGEVRLVRTQTGEELARLTAPEQSRMVPQAFTPDGGQLVTLGNDTLALHVFDLRAIRAQLRELGLDWAAPPLPPSPETDGQRPMVLREHLDVQVELGTIRERVLADALVARAGQHQTNKEYEQAVQTLREAIRVDPAHALAHNNLAWLLLTGPKEMRNPTEALPLARKLVELSPDQATYHNTLGVALYRVGQFAEAIGALETSLSRSQDKTDAFDLFFLAMCHYRLGDAVKATDCRDRAARWFAEHRDKLSAPWVDELTEFQTEAACVLSQPPGQPDR